MSLLFFVKPSKINLDLFTTSVMVYNMAKIEPAIKFVPQWWKDLPSSVGDHPHVRNGTLKKCSGFIELYKAGFIIPMWCDLAVDIGPIGSNFYRYQYSDRKSMAEEHPEIQRKNFCNKENYQHLKLTSPWYVTSKQSIDCVFMDVVWNDVNLLPYRVLTGILNFKYANQLNVNMMFIKKENEQNILIPYKTPIVHLIPMTDKKIKLNYHLVDEKELDKKITSSNVKVKFLNRFQTYKSSIK